MRKAMGNKSQKIVYIFLNYFFAPLLFCWLAYSIYSQIIRQPNLDTKWKLIRESVASFGGLMMLFLVIGLMILNWSFEAQKWKTSVKLIQPLSFRKSFMAVLTGVSFSVTTPNRIGEYLGRMLYMEEGKRLKVVALTIVCSMSQLIITLLAGLLGLILLQRSRVEQEFVAANPDSLWLKILQWGNLLEWLVLIGLVSLTLFYFRLSFLVNHAGKWKKGKWFFLVSSLRELNATLLARLLSLSAARYLVFIAQYYFLLQLFDVEISGWNVFVVVSVIFLVLAIVPSFTIAELGLRGGVSLALLGMFSQNQLGIGMTTASIWLINLVVPAILGSLLILRIKILKNRNEKNSDSHM